MKKIIIATKNIILLLLLLLFQNSFSQKIDKETPKEFATEFNNDIEKSNFKHLRDFLSRKQNEKTSLTAELRYNNMSRYDTDNINARLKYLDNLIAASGKNEDKIIELRNDIEDIEDIDEYSSVSKTKPVTVKFVKEIREDLILKKTINEQTIVLIEKIKNSLKNIDQDINDCQNQIDEALNPENKRQDFKKTMSMCFVGLIGLILICFFSIIYLRSDFTLSKDLLGGYGLQFITLFVLIIAIILFGILDILKGSELAAMLSGISGYILGKGIQDKKLVTENNTTTPNPTVSPLTIITDPIIPVNTDPVNQNSDIQNTVNTAPIIPKPNEDTESNNL